MEEAGSAMSTPTGYCKLKSPRRGHRSEPCGPCGGTGKQLWKDAGSARRPSACTVRLQCPVHRMYKRAPSAVRAWSPLGPSQPAALRPPKSTTTSLISCSISEADAAAHLPRAPSHPLAATRCAATALHLVLQDRTANSSSSSSQLILHPLQSG